MNCLYVFVVGFAVCYPFADTILGVLRRPLFAALPLEQQKLYYTGLFENFLMHLKISGYGSLFLFSPFYFYQLWAFISPGLYPKERKLVLPFLAAATFFFLAGAGFAYFILFPVGFKYFVTYGGPADFPLLTISSYYDTCLKLMLLFGLSFELPVMICLLGILGLVDATMLRTHRRSAIIGITVLAALFAPPDAMSMIILGVPLVLMYEGAILVVAQIGKRRPVSESQTANDSTQDQSKGNPLHGGSKS